MIRDSIGGSIIEVSLGSDPFIVILCLIICLIICFDGQLRKTEAAYNNEIVVDVEHSCNFNNQREFWSFISKLGPRRSAQILMKVYGNNNILTTHLKTVLDEWGSECSTLYNKPENNESDDNREFYRNVMNLKQVRKAQMENPLHEENPELNGRISFDKFEKIINKLKINTSSGIDQIPHN